MKCASISISCHAERNRNLILFFYFIDYKSYIKDSTFASNVNKTPYVLCEVPPFALKPKQKTYKLDVIVVATKSEIKIGQYREQNVFVFKQ